jgi:hypothetical protein
VVLCDKNTHFMQSCDSARSLLKKPVTKRQMARLFHIENVLQRGVSMREDDILPYKERFTASRNPNRKQRKRGRRAGSLVLSQSSVLREQISLMRDKRCVEHARHAQELIDKVRVTLADAQLDGEIISHRKRLAAGCFYAGG